MYSTVRRKCVVQWFSAYSRVTVEEVEKQFPMSRMVAEEEGGLEKELEEMIRNGDLEARIDLVDKVRPPHFPSHQSLSHTNDEKQVLVSPNPDPRISTITDTLSMAKTTEHALRLRLHAINMKAAGFVLKAPGNAQSVGNMLGEMGDAGSAFFRVEFVRLGMLTSKL